MKPTALFCAITIFCSTLIHAQTTWNNIGPMRITNTGTGVIKQVAMGKTIGLASSPDGGLWLCRNLLINSWEPITDQLPNLEVLCFGMSDLNNSKIYLALSGHLLYKTLDLGINWTEIDASPLAGAINVLITDPVDDERLYAGTERGLYVSDNGGARWRVLLSNEDITDIKIDPQDNAVLYIGSRFQGIKKSTNRGNTFLTKLPSVVTDTASTSPSKIKIDLGVRNASGTLQTATAKTVLVKMGRQVYISSNSGETFTILQNISDSMSKGSETGGSARRIPRRIRTDWNNVIAVNPFNANVLLIGQENLYRSTNGGTSWVMVETNHEDQQSLAFSKTSAGHILAANDGGVQKSVDAANSFQKFQHRLCVSQLLRAGIKGEQIVVNIDHNGLIASIPNSTDWERANFPKDNACGFSRNNMEDNAVYNNPFGINRYFVLFRDDERVPLNPHLIRLRYPRTAQACVGDIMPVGNFLPYTTASKPGFPQKPLAAFTIDSVNSKANYVFICTEDTSHTRFHLLYTQQGEKEPTGATRGTATNLMNWKTILSDTIPFASVYYHERSKKLYVISATGKLYFKRIGITDPDINWVVPDTITNITDSSIRDLEVAASNTDFIYTVSGKSLYMSMNSGATWVQRPVFAAASPNQVYGFTLYEYKKNGQDIRKILLATSVGIYESIDNGVNWKKHTNFPSVKVSQLQISDNRLYAVTYGRGVWRIRLISLED